MSAADIQLVTIVVPNPMYDSSKTASVISSKYAFTQRITSQFQTLSNTNPQNLDPIEGLLYVPELSDDATALCSVAMSLIPNNATTLDNFPNGQDYPLVAFFPWTSVDCTQAFLSQARADAARAVITFLPNYTSGLDPPNPGDNAWNLNDNNRWKSVNQYPVYAVQSNNGPNLLNQLSLYSGNMSDAPNGQQLIQNYPPRDFPRLFAHIDIQGGSQVPSLWIFLIIVLAVLLGIVIVASIIMHFIQRHQRRVLQRRLERGEIDLETLGIKKMNVPQHKIDEMPKYVFTQAIEAPAAAQTSSTTKSAKATTSTQPQAASFSQDTCAICLDEFVGGESEVRELPCKHIFHPECIDIFLRDNSSLCPMCKKSALPAGYIPVKVTNMMVRRERIVRRMRERRRVNMLAMEGREDDRPVTGSAPVRAARRLKKFFWPAAPPPYVAEMRNRNRADTVATMEEGQAAPQPLDTRRQTMAVPAEVADQGDAARRAWRRERLAIQLHEQYASQAERTRQADEGRPLWRRIVSRIAPGFD